MPRAPRALVAVVPLLALTTLGLGGGAVADGLDVGATAQTPALAVACGPGSLWFQAALTGPPGYTTPAGVITSWSTMAPKADAGSVALKVARRTATRTFAVVGSSAPQPLTAGGLNTFLTRIPVHAGDELGLGVASTAPRGPCVFDTGAAASGDVVTGGPATTDAPVGSTFVSPADSPRFRLDVTARVEPDADGDGYGDLTQDACPTLANSHTDCTPPDTLLASAPKKVVTRTKAAWATIVFYATESGTTHTCAVDAGAAAACTSPFAPKLATGRHTVRITSTDAVGNVDPTPLTFTVKVKRKR